MTDVRSLIQEQVRIALRTHPANDGPMTANEIFKHVDCANDVAEVAEALRSLQAAGIATKAGAYGWRLCGTVAPPMSEARVAAVAEPARNASTPPAAVPSSAMTAKEALIAFGRARECFSVKEALAALSQYNETTLRWHVKDLQAKGVLERLAIGKYRVLDADRIGERVAAQDAAVECSTGNDGAQIDERAKPASESSEELPVSMRPDAEGGTQSNVEHLLTLRLEQDADEPNAYKLSVVNCRGVFMVSTGPLDILRSIARVLLQENA